MNWAASLFLFCYLTKSTFEIYVPGDSIKQPPTKQIDLTSIKWKGNEFPIQIHHNYSKVNVQQQTNDNLPINSGFPHQVEQIDITDQIEQSQLEDVGQKTLDQEEESDYGWFVQELDPFDGFGQIEVGSQHSKLSTTPSSVSKNKNFDQHLENVDQKVENLDQKVENLDQQVEDFEQKAEELEDQLRPVHKQKVTKTFSVSTTYEQFAPQNQGASHNFRPTNVNYQRQISEVEVKPTRQIYSNAFNAHSQNYKPPAVRIPEGTPVSRPPIKIIVRKPKRASIQPEVYSKCPKSATGQFVYELSCNQFLNCWKGRGIVQNCAPGTLFNPLTLECDYAEKVECISGPRSIRSFQSSKPADLKQATCPEGFSGLIPHYSNCTKFINCNNGNGREMECPPGTKFDIKSNTCEHANKCTCVFAEDQKQELNNGGNYFDTEAIYGQNGLNVIEKGYWSSPQNVIENNNQLVDSNRRNWHTNRGHYIVRENVNINDHMSEFTDQKPQQKIQTSSQYSPGQSNTNAGSKLDPSFCRGKTGIYPHPYNCKQFINCMQGRALTQDCGFGTVFNPNLKACDMPSNVDCNAKTHTNIQVPTITHTIKPTINQYQNGANLQSLETQQNEEDIRPDFCHGKAGLYQHPFDCSKFIQCTNKQATIHSCGPGMLFNHVSRNCDYQTRVDCKASKTAASFLLPSSTVVQERVACPSFASGLIPHPFECSKFLNCANGMTFIQDCGPGTVFNPVSKVCDFPYNVKCANKASIITTQQSHTGGINDNLNWGGINDNLDWGNKGLETASSQVHPVRYNHHHHHHHGGHGQTTNGTYNSEGRGKWRPAYPYHHGRDPIATGPPISFSTHPPLARPSQGREVGTGQTGVYGYGYQGPTGQNTNIQQIPNQRPLPNSYQPTRRPSTIPNYNTDPLQEGNLQINWWKFTPQSSPPTSTTESYTFVIYGKPTEIPLNSGKSQVKPGYGTTNQNSIGSDIENTKFIDTDDDLIEPNGENTFFGESNIDTVNRPPKGLKPTVGTQWPPPFPSTDLNADYVFEDYDDSTVVPTSEPKKFGPHNRTNCVRDDFKCGPNDCIKPHMVCDINKDCANGMDEKNCAKYLEYFSIRPGSRLARVENKKLLNITLPTCARYCFETKMFKCLSFNYRKVDGACFLLTTNIGLSGGLILMNSYDYFELTSGTVDCTNKFMCNDNKCIHQSKVCDGNNDCVDRGDEKNCNAEKIGYKMKLAGSKLPNEGRIEVTVFGKTGYVCDDRFGMRNAEVVCREMGYDMGAVEVKGNSYFAQDIKENDTLYLMDDVNCFGNETNLKDCDFNGWGITNCLEQEIVGVICKTAQRKCPKDSWKCDSNDECIPMAFLCDGVDDCKDKSDEGAQNCEAPVDIRLVNATTKLEGRVEVRYHNTWGTICDDDFNDDAAKVVCNSLGYRGASKVVKDGKFGQGDGPIWLDQVYCKGNETAVHHCTHWNWGEHNCEHTEDVGVICSNVTNIQATPRPFYQAPVEHHERKLKRPVEIYPNKCGIRSDAIFEEGSNIHFRVVKGAAAKRGDYPWQASLRVKGKSKAAHWCGAIVISQKFVLTAAHCLTGFPKASFIVAAGDYDVNEDEGTEQEAYIEELYPHKDFRKGSKMNNDIALIKLKGHGFLLKNGVGAICLPDKDDKYTPGMNCTISGFGSVASGKSSASHELRAGWIPLLSDNVCKMPHVYGDAIKEGMICAGSLDEGIDACDGDSGGPLACLNNGLFTLYGITSWGQHCGYANKPGVYVKINFYRDWIDRILKEHS